MNTSNRFAPHNTQDTRALWPRKRRRRQHPICSSDYAALWRMHEIRPKEDNILAYVSDRKSGPSQWTSSPERGRRR
eukprot:5730288-Pyramimonas_sp.AAC.1